MYPAGDPATYNESLSERGIAFSPPSTVYFDQQQPLNTNYNFDDLSTNTDSIGTSYPYTQPNVAPAKPANQPNGATIQRVR